MLIYFGNGHRRKVVDLLIYMILVLLATPFLTRGSVATKFRKNEAESCLKFSESCLLSCELRLRVAYISEISRGPNMSTKKIGIFFSDFSDGEQNLCF